MELKEKFHASFPEAFFLEHQVSEALSAYIRQQGWVEEKEEIVSLEKPGEGNMNVVVRVITSRRAFILKQARPWVHTYPQVAAPMERIAVEASFYQLIAHDALLKTFTPNLIGFDPANFMMALEDLGEGADYTFLYQQDQKLTLEELQQLIRFIAQLHKIRSAAEKTDFPENRAMKVLNHEHIFRYPFIEDNGLDLDTVQEGLQQVSLAYKQNATLKKKIAGLGELYLQTGSTLIHGDYYPGSWLKVASGVKVIDPEFGYFGRPEFDVGVMIAHFKMAQQEESFIQKALAYYETPVAFDEKLLWSFAGVEILRRIIGLAQLPLSLSLPEKEQLLEEAANYILQH